MSVTFTVNGVDYVYRNPELGNTDAISFQRVANKTRGGDLIVFRDPEWPKTEVLSLQWSFSLEADFRRMLNMIRTSIGTLIHYRDHENRLWLGVIQNPETEGTQAGRNSWVIDINFEGDLV
jgi:hypothetical protein